MARGGNTYAPEVQHPLLCDELRMEVIARYRREVEQAKARAEEHLRLITLVKRFGGDHGVVALGREIGHPVRARGASPLGRAQKETPAELLTQLAG